MPVPRGPSSHLWPLLTKASQPSCSIAIGPAPSACAPSTSSSVRLSSARPRFAFSTACAISCSGSRIAGRRLHPRHHDEAGRGPDRPLDGGDDSLHRRPLGGGRRIELDLAHLGAGALGRVANRLARHVVLVLGQQHVVARLQLHRADQQPEAHRGRVGQRDQVRVGTEVLGRRLRAPLLQPLVVGEVLARVLVEPTPVTFDRLAHRQRMRSEDEYRQVGDVGIEVEQPADGVPVLVAAGRRRGGGAPVPGSRSPGRFVAVEAAAQQRRGRQAQRAAQQAAA